MLRPTKKFGSLQVYKPNRQTAVTSTDTLVSTVNQVAQEVYVPAIRQKSQNALQVDKIPVQFYQEIRTGRLCSCFKKEYDAPETSCLVCFGSGRVGGYNLYGHTLEVIDATKENLSMVNVQVNDEVWPWRFELIEDTLEGYVDAVINVPSILDVTVLKLFSTGNYFRTFVRKSSDTAWHRLTRSAILSLAAVESTLVVRVILSRKTTADATPTFTHFYIRYQLLDKTLYADMPKLEGLHVADNFALEGLQTSEAFFSADLPIITINDFFKDTRRNVLWKVTGVTKNDPLGVVTSWDVHVRSIESFEIYNQVP